MAGSRCEYSFDLLPSSSDPLDLIDRRRFDADAICDRLNEFDDLPEDVRERYLAIWDYAGLDEASHPFTQLLGESHNTTAVVRDIEGPLMFMWEDGPVGETTWKVGPLYADHLPSDEELVELLGTDDAEGGLDLGVVRQVIASLPTAPGPVRSY